MGNCARRLVVEAPEQITMSGVGASATRGETSSSHAALEKGLPSGHDVAFGDRNSAGSSMEQKSEYFSPRVEEMIQSNSQFSSDVERETEHSRVHWSEVPGLSDLSVDKHHGEEVSRENREVFAELMNDPQWEHHEEGHFFEEWIPIWKLGQKIAEGGQAAIFEVIDPDGNIFTDRVLKVFKRGSRLLDLKKQWPSGVLRKEVFSLIFKGFMLEDGRFAFMMPRCWGDLRKLIDQAMQEKNNQGPPFPYKWKGEILFVRDIMNEIAFSMERLHMKGIAHRDLKAANVLLYVGGKGIVSVVVDYECSIGVVGTGFWRAPEILLALKNYRSTFDFIEKMDVYSYGMTCFEIVTGRLPFEGELEACRTSYNLVIAGQRPKLHSDLDVRWKGLIEKCWNPIPNERPSFGEIIQVFRTFWWSIIMVVGI